MSNATSFFIWASGADRNILEQCPEEKTKYVGIGGTVIFTGLFAAVAASYALFTVFDNYWIAGFIGFFWGLMIFNLDRFIVSSMKKERKFYKEFLTALPRIFLAVLISIVIAKPLELKIFEKEIEPQLIIMEEQVRTKEEDEIRKRFEGQLTQSRNDIDKLKMEIADKTKVRDALAVIAQQEADGTGGSKVKNLGPIFKVKKADEDRANAELQTITNNNSERIQTLEHNIAAIQSKMDVELASITHARLNGPAARLDALSRLTQNSSAMWWTNLFIMFLFFMLETSPIFVKLISGSGPYDALLHSKEHLYRCRELETVAQQSSETRKRAAEFLKDEEAYVVRNLDAELG